MLRAWKKDAWLALAWALAGFALGLLANALSPRGFDFWMAAGLK